MHFFRRGFSEVGKKEKADTVLVTGVHDLDAYLHSQLLLAVRLFRFQEVPHTPKADHQIMLT